MRNLLNPRILAGAFSAIALGLVSSAPLSAAIYIKIDGIDGESQDAGHVNDIEVLGWSWGASTSASVSGGSRQVSEPKLKELTLIKEIDKASPYLALSVADRGVIPNAQLIVKKQAGPGGDPLPYLTIELTNVIITSYSVSGGADNSVPSEDFSLNFEEIRIQYSQVDNDTGTVVDQTEMAWNALTNEAPAPQ